MAWTVKFVDDFKAEFDDLPGPVQDSILARALLLEREGPSLGRPHVDTLKGSRHSNMKELRFNAEDGVWRVAFAFDPERSAMLLIAGDKSGVNQKRFYKKFMNVADARFDKHLAQQKANKT